MGLIIYSVEKQGSLWLTKDSPYKLKLICEPLELIKISYKIEFSYSSHIVNIKNDKHCIELCSLFYVTTFLWKFIPN